MYPLPKKRCRGEGGETYNAAKNDSGTQNVKSTKEPKDDAAISRTSVGRGACSDTGVSDVAEKSLVPLWGTASGRAAALSLACADTDTSRGKADESKDWHAK